MTPAENEQVVLEAMDERARGTDMCRWCGREVMHGERHDDACPLVRLAALRAQAEAGPSGEALLRIRELEAINAQLVRSCDRAREALREIEVSDVDWTLGADENMEHLRQIARVALAGEGTIPDPIVSSRVPTEAMFEHARKLSKERNWKDVRP